MQFDSQIDQRECAMTAADTDMTAGTTSGSKRLKVTNPPIIFSKDGKANKTKQDTMKFNLQDIDDDF